MMPNTSLEPTPITPVSLRFGFPPFGSHGRRGSVLGRWASLRAMRFSSVCILLILLIVGCSRRDAKMREQICGSWDGGVITYLPDGSWHFHNELVVSNVTLKWTSDGTWDVKDGYLISTTTNSTSENTTERSLVGRVDRFKITFLDAHNLCGTNERDGFAEHR